MQPEVIMHNTLSTKEVGPVEYSKAIDVHAYIAFSASYKGSAPFCGIFQAWDVDECFRIDADGRKFIFVECQWEDQEQDDMLELELHDRAIHSIVDWEGRVVKRIGDLSQTYWIAILIMLDWCAF